MEKTIKKIKLSPKTYIEVTSMYPEIMYKIKAKGFTPTLIDDETFKGQVYHRLFVETPNCKL